MSINATTLATSILSALDAALGAVTGGQAAARSSLASSIASPVAAAHNADAGSPGAIAENASAPPAASAVYLGLFYYYRPASSSGQLLFCQKTSSGGYEWTVVAQASL